MLSKSRGFLYAGAVGSLIACGDADFVSPSAATHDDVISARVATTLTRYAFGPAASESVCLSEGALTGDWRVRYHGFGCVAVETNGAATTLFMTPADARAPGETHAPLALGPDHGGSLVVNATIETLYQTRAGSAPNPWEVAWLAWHYTDDEHFYYFIPKPNGWELGKRDPAYPGGQRFLATGTDRVFPIGRPYRISVRQRGSLIVVAVDDNTVVTFRDQERPYFSGRLALYSEDAAIRVHEVAAQ